MNLIILIQLIYFYAYRFIQLIFYSFIGLLNIRSSGKINQFEISGEETSYIFSSFIYFISCFADFVRKMRFKITKNNVIGNNHQQINSFSKNKYLDPRIFRDFDIKNQKNQFCFLGKLKKKKKGQD